MRSAFTLIELLVVLVIMVVVMGLVMPQGSKMLDNFTRSLDKTKDKQKLSSERSLCFIQAKESSLDVLDATYHISSKGVLTRYEKSNDNN